MLTGGPRVGGKGQSPAVARLDSVAEPESFTGRGLAPRDRSSSRVRTALALCGQAAAGDTARAGSHPT